MWLISLRSKIINPSHHFKLTFRDCLEEKKVLPFCLTMVMYFSYSSFQYIRHPADLHTFCLVKTRTVILSSVLNGIAWNLKHGCLVIVHRAQCHHVSKILHNSCSVFFYGVSVWKTVQCKTRTVILSSVLNQIVWNLTYTWLVVFIRAQHHYCVQILCNPISGFYLSYFGR